MDMVGIRHHGGRGMRDFIGNGDCDLKMIMWKMIMSWKMVMMMSTIMMRVISMTKIIAIMASSGLAGGRIQRRCSGTLRFAIRELTRHWWWWCFSGDLQLFGGFRGEGRGCFIVVVLWCWLRWFSCCWCWWWWGCLTMRNQYRAAAERCRSWESWFENGPQSADLTKHLCHCHRPDMMRNMTIWWGI